MNKSYIQNRFEDATVSRAILLRIQQDRALKDREEQLRRRTQFKLTGPALTEAQKRRKRKLRKPVNLKSEIKRGQKLTKAFQKGERRDDEGSEVRIVGEPVVVGGRTFEAPEVADRRRQDEQAERDRRFQLDAQVRAAEVRQEDERLRLLGIENQGRLFLEQQREQGRQARDVEDIRRFNLQQQRQEQLEDRRFQEEIRRYDLQQQERAADVALRGQLEDREYDERVRQFNERLADERQEAQERIRQIERQDELEAQRIQSNREERLAEVAQRQAQRDAELQIRTGEIELDRDRVRAQVERDKQQGKQSEAQLLGLREAQRVAEAQQQAERELFERLRREAAAERERLLNLAEPIPEIPRDMTDADRRFIETGFQQAGAELDRRFEEREQRLFEHIDEHLNRVAPGDQQRRDELRTTLRPTGSQEEAIEQLRQQVGGEVEQDALETGLRHDPRDIDPESTPESDLSPEELQRRRREDPLSDEGSLDSRGSGAERELRRAQQEEEQEALTLEPQATTLTRAQRAARDSPVQEENIDSPGLRAVTPTPGIETPEFEQSPILERAGQGLVAAGQAVGGAIRELTRGETAEEALERVEREGQQRAAGRPAVEPGTQATGGALVTPEGQPIIMGQEFDQDVQEEYGFQVVGANANQPTSRRSARDSAEANQRVEALPDVPTGGGAVAGRGDVETIEEEIPDDAGDQARPAPLRDDLRRNSGRLWDSEDTQTALGEMVFSGAGRGTRTAANVYRIRNNTDKTVSKIPPGGTAVIYGGNNQAGGTFRLRSSDGSETRMTQKRMNTLIKQDKLIFERNR